MPDSATLLTFVGITAVFAAVPGPSNLFVVSQGLRAGYLAGLAAAAGCALGALTYVAATTVGLAAVLASSAPALSVLHYVGGAYLLFLGIRLLRDRDAFLASDVGGSGPRRRRAFSAAAYWSSSPTRRLRSSSLPSPVRRPAPRVRLVADPDPGRDLLCNWARLGFPLRSRLGRNSEERRRLLLAAPSLVEPGEVGRCVWALVPGRFCRGRGRRPGE
jgi:LysE type translocator